MTGFRCIETSTTLRCGRETRPPVDGMRTVCGERFGPTMSGIDRTRFFAREFGWVASGSRDYCPVHKHARLEEAA